MDTNSAEKWAEFVKFFNQQNSGRPTRIGVFESANGRTTDYWLENGLPLIGLDLDWHEGLPTVQMSLEGMSRSVKDATQIGFKLSTSGEEDGVDVTDRDGNTVVLRFNIGSGDQPVSV